MADENVPLNIPGGPSFLQRLWSEEVAIALANSGEPIDTRDNGYEFSSGRVFKDNPYTAPVVVIQPSAPVNTVAPVVSGTAISGSLLSCTTGTWSGYPSPTLTYQWKADGTPIGGATSSTYTTIAGQSGQSITCTVTATNSAGSASAGSNGITVITAPVNTVAPVISGDLPFGSVLTSTTGTWTGTPTITYSYQWKADGATIVGETANTYTTIEADIGVSITCLVTASNSGGSASAVSNAIIPVEAFSPLSIFASGEQGAWYDPSDFSTIFQDSAGTAPVTEVGQNVGLILDKSKGLTGPSYPPSGFGTVPFNVTVSSDGTTDFVPTVYRLTEGDSGVTTYYVDKATGSDSNPGTSVSPFKTVFKAISTSRGSAPKVLVKAKGGTYFLTENFNNKPPEATDLSIVSWDGLPVICSNENPNITPASWTLDSDSTYWASVAGYGYSEYRSSAWDAKIGDGFGDYLPLIPAVSIAACKATANTYFTDQAASRIYVHCSDNRAPDVDVHVFEAWGAPGQYLDYPGAPAVGNCYFENIHFYGGAIAFTLQQTHATNTITAVFNGCSFRYAGIAYPQAVSSVGNLDVAFCDCIVSESHGDGFSYKVYGANPAPRAIEISCEARKCGAILAGTANQGSTVHDGGKIVRANGTYHYNENDQVADVGAGTKTWMVACDASNSLKSNYAAYLCGNGVGASQMWLYDCTSSGCSKDLYIGSGSTLNDKNYASRSVISNSGTVTNYGAIGLLGNHSYQATAESRPALANNANTKPYRNFDAVDDSMGTTFASSLGASCTVARADPVTGATILTAQTIGTSYSASADDCALIVVDRALTPQETADLTAWLNEKAGV